uniref:Uncharacterized protein n=1 Tax=Anguilla anguilla TaxID=7936 RepID=A0A0E9R9H9_ANGAN
MRGGWPMSQHAAAWESQPFSLFTPDKWERFKRLMEELIAKKATCTSVKTGSRNSQQDTPGTHVGKVYFCERISLP